MNSQSAFYPFIKIDQKELTKNACKYVCEAVLVSAYKKKLSSYAGRISNQIAYCVRSEKEFLMTHFASHQSFPEDICGRKLQYQIKHRQVLLFLYEHKNTWRDVLFLNDSQCPFVICSAFMS